MTNTALVHDTQNDTRYADAMAVVRELGRDDAGGKDALPNLAIHFARQVYDGVFDPAKDAQGEDAATRIFKTYAMAAGKKAIHDRTEGGLKANVSKLRQIQNAASNPKFDFVDVLNRAHTIRQDAMDNDVEVKPAYAAFVDVAREQLKLDEEMTDEMILAAVSKTENTKEVTLEGQLKKAAKILEDIITGEKHPGVIDQSPEVLAASEQLTARINALLIVKEQKAALEKAMAAGYVLQEDGSLALAAAK